MSRGSLRDVIAKNRAAGRASFIPYLTVGDPNLAATELYAETLVRLGADAIELGVPYSDPVADGPTNLKAAERALKAGTKLQDVLDLSARLRSKGITTPFVLFSYYNPMLRPSLPRFAELAEKSGIDAVLTVDLPVEEAGELVSALEGRGIGTVFLASPTTPSARIERVANFSTEFIYYVSRLGVTGAQAALSPSLASEIAALRRATGLPIGVGFGISTPEQAAAVAKVADAVIVGSAIVKKIEENPEPKSADQAIETLVKPLIQAIQAVRQTPQET